MARRDRSLILEDAAPSALAEAIGKPVVMVVTGPHRHGGAEGRIQANDGIYIGTLEMVNLLGPVTDVVVGGWRVTITDLVDRPGDPTVRAEVTLWWEE